MKLMRHATISLWMLANAVLAQEEPTFRSNPFIPHPLAFMLQDRGSQANRESQRSPWQNDLQVYRTDAGGKIALMHTFKRAGVPTMTRLKDGRIIAAFQHFPKDDEQNFDRVAVSFSSNDGASWNKPQPISIEGMEQGLARAFDPTLVVLPDGRVRLYFTSNRSPRFEESTPAIYSAVSKDGIHYQFEPGVRFAIEGRIVIDCAACLHNGTFHLIVPDNGTAADMRREMENNQPPRSSSTGYHAISKDGLNFQRLSDLKLEGDVRWLGNLQSDGTKMTFIGTGRGVWMATSTDGVRWTPFKAPAVPGADPGAVQCADNTWLVITTGRPRS
jgi:hypothetical protein